MKRSLDHLRQGLHSLKDLAWYGSSCRCGLWVVVTRVPGDPLLAAILPWHKPFAWRWAREELTEALIEQWPQSSWTAGPESHPVMLALCHAKASRLLEDALAEGDLAIVHRDRRGSAPRRSQDWRDASCSPGPATTRDPVQRLQ